MSNKTQLQTNNTALDALITRVNATKDTAASLPEAGSGGSGGANVDTCTVQIKLTFGGKIKAYGCAILENGIVSSEINLDINLTESITIQNVLCNSLLYISIEDHPGMIAITNLGYVTSYDSARLYSIIASAGETATIETTL